MNHFEKLFSAICRPNPKAFPDKNEASIAFSKNKFIFGVHLTLISVHLCSMPFYDFRAATNFDRFIMQLVMVTFFLIFCRSHPFLGRVINAIVLNIVSIKIVHFNPEGALLGFTICYGTPILVFYVTQNVTLTGISSLLQFSLVILTIKSNLIEAVSFTDPEVFAQRFVQRSVPLSILVQILTLFVVFRLNYQSTELWKATRKAEEALDQQKTFVYSFSHEMRNPMNSLLGNLDLALMGEIAPDVREMIGTAKICGVLLLNLINTVLDAGKLGLGKLEVNPVPTRVHDVFQRVWALSHEMITRKGLKSHLKISRQVPPRLILDSHRLNQVLMNLLGNATKFTEHGMIVLSVNWLQGDSEITEDCFVPVPYDDDGEGVFEKDYNVYAIKRQSKYAADTSMILSGGVKEFNLEGVLHPSAEEKGVLKIVIRDTGCGMNPEELSKLFQKFSQVGQVTTKRQIGTGLGLFISKEIVENMRGEIRVYSKPKIGTTFIICIPTTALPMQPGSEQEVNINDHLIPKLRSKRLTTIVADDSAFNVSLVSNFYSKIGVEVLATASNGQVAYERYLEIVKKNGKIDIITLDIDMPLMNGKEVCERIRVYEKENDLKRSMIVLISGNYEEEDMLNLLRRENGESSQADCFLRKPLVFEELCFAVYKHHCYNRE